MPDGERVGSRALSVFARVLNARILRAHSEGALSSSELERRLGWAPKASLRVATLNLCEVGALVRAGPPDVRTGLVTELTDAGAELLFLADVVERWLSRSPFGAISLPDTAARGAVRALTAGWDAAIIENLAVKPRTLAELSANIPAHSYPMLKRRLAKLRSANLVTSVPDGKRSPLHAATEWLRCAVGPLSAASRWERRHLPHEVARPSRSEVEAAFLLALPLVDLPGDLSGTCTLAAPTSTNGDIHLAAVSLAVEDGQVVSSSPGTDDTPSAWALGTPDAWFDAIVKGHLDALRIRGASPRLARGVADGLHRVLFFA